MQQVDIEVVTGEAGQAHLTRAANLLRAEAGPAAATEGSGCNLRADKEGVRHPPQRDTDHRLVSGVEVVLGCIHPVDACLVHGVQDGGGPSDL